MIDPRIYHRHLLATSEYERLRALREKAVAEGTPAEAWDETLAGARLQILDAWWTLMEDLTRQLKETRRGRVVLWLLRQRLVIWMFRKWR